MQKIDSKILEQTLEVGVAQWYAYDSESGLELYSGSLSTHDLTKSVDEGEEIIGGENGDILYTIPGKSSFEFTAIDRFNNTILESIKMGTLPTKVGVQQGLYSIHMPKSYTIIEDATKLVVPLDKTPLEGEIVRAYKNNGTVMIEPTKAVLSADRTKLEITDTGVLAGSKVFVTGFKYAPSQETLMSVIKSDATSPDLLLAVDVPLFNSGFKLIKRKKYIFPKAQLNASTSSKGQAEKKGQEAETKIKILKHPLEELGYIYYEDVV